MKYFFLLFAFPFFCSDVEAQRDSLEVPDQLAINKEIARKFYSDLWFSNHTDKYGNYVADEYVVHDIWNRKGLTEPAIEQKYIADAFWNNGTLQGEIDFQIADGDLVATRWHASLEPKTLFGRVLAMDNLAIINVFRIEDGKIVEIWNHRHDIETNQTLQFVAQGLLIGLFISLIPTIYAIRLKRRLKAIQNG